MTRIAMIGGGPKCLFALLELNDSLAAGAAHLLHVDVYDPYPPGAGRVWNTGQPRELRLNVNSRIIDASWSLCAQTFNQFRDRQTSRRDPRPLSAKGACRGIPARTIRAAGEPRIAARPASGASGGKAGTPRGSMARGDGLWQLALRRGGHRHRPRTRG
ncbi:FAD/NAD(P)-binding protein [Glutamicibacter halophytocola]